MKKLKHIRLYEDWNTQINESSKPGELKVIYADQSKGKYQHYETLIKKPTVNFDSFKKDFLAHPQKYLTNVKSTFHQPTDGNGSALPGLKIGAFIQIDIASIMTAFVKVTQLYETAEGILHATFVTLEGHPEKGYINFKISKEGEKDIKFEISSLSETNTMAPEEFARSEQQESWFSMLKKLPSLLGGTGTPPLLKHESPQSEKFTNNLLKKSGRTDASQEWQAAVASGKPLIVKNATKDTNVSSGKPLIAKNATKDTKRPGRA